MDRIAIVGASAAGLGVAENLRREGYEGSIVLIGDEIHPPYDRPPLSKQVLKGEWPIEKVRLRDAEVLERAGVQLRLGTRAVGLNAATRSIELADGSTIAYDGLAVATGVRPRPLAFEGVPTHIIRTLEDALALGDALRTARSLLVIGAGFLGVETAAVARELGLEVHVVDIAPLPITPVGEAIGSRVARLHRERGVDLHLGVGIQTIAPESDGARATLSDGTVIRADVVVAAVGSLPNTEWLEGSGLTLENGVVCDEFCIAADGVVAAGDVARWRHPHLGRHVRVEHRMNATEQSRAAARSLLGHREPFAPVAYFWTDQFDVKIQAYGEISPAFDFEVVEGDIDDERFAGLYRDGGRVVGALTWNLPRAARTLRQQVVDAATASVAEVR